MKKILLLLAFGPCFTACNKSVDMVYVEPQENLLAPDYNLLSSGTRLILHGDGDHFYSQLAIYLRPFENVNPNDEVTLELTSDQDSRFVLPHDTLFTGDKINIKYLDFDRYIYNLRYETNTAGKHNITIQTTIRKVSKSSNLGLNTIF